MVFVLATLGLPGTSGFVGEFLILVGAFKVNIIVAIMASRGNFKGLYTLCIRGWYLKLDNVQLKKIKDKL